MKTASFSLMLLTIIYAFFNVACMHAQDTLTASELHLLEMRHQENNTSVISINSAIHKSLLEKRSRTINPNAQGISSLLAEMEKAVAANDGVGIAAIQIGIPVKVVLIRRLDENTTPKFQPLINPSIIKTSETYLASWENCLSVPWGYRFTYRPNEITIRFQTSSGESMSETFKGEEAIVLQQEIEHTNGILLSSGYSKEWFIPNQEMKAFAQAIWKQCQSLDKTQCESLMKSRWEERAKKYGSTPHIEN